MSQPMSKTQRAQSGEVWRRMGEPENVQEHEEMLSLRYDMLVTNRNTQLLLHAQGLPQKKDKAWG